MIGGESKTDLKTQIGTNRKDCHPFVLELSRAYEGGKKEN